MDRKKLLESGFISIGTYNSYEYLAAKDPFDEEYVRLCMFNKRGEQIGKPDTISVDETILRYKAVKLLYPELCEDV